MSSVAVAVEADDPGTLGEIDARQPPAEPISFVGRSQFGPDRLILDRGLTDLVIRQRMSPSASEAIASCAARWAIDKLLLRPDDPFGAAELGTATHQVFEDLFSMPADQRDLEAARSILRDLEVTHPDMVAPRGYETEALDRWRDEIDRRMVGLWTIEDPKLVAVSATEMRLETVDITGVPFKGVIDRVDVVGGGKRIVDFKAGMSAPKKASSRFGDPHGHQLRLYAMALAAIDGTMPVSADVHYVAHGKTRNIPLSPRLLAETRQRFVRTWDAMGEFQATGEFTATASPLCGWCPLAMVCPTAAAAGKGEARVPSAEIGVTLGIAPYVPVPSQRLPESAAAHSDFDEATEYDQPSFALAGHTVGPPSSVLQSPTSGNPTRPAGRIENGAFIMRTEDKAWVEAVEGALNLNSFAATAVFGLAELAVDILSQAGQRVNPATVFGLADTFAHIVARAQEALGCRESMQDGAHMRLRGALRTSLETIPVPFGGTAEEWEAWATRTQKRVVAIAVTAIRLWQEGGANPTPWSALVEMTTAPADSSATETAATGAPFTSVPVAA